jgi:hypothetical protein
VASGYHLSDPVYRVGVALELLTTQQVLSMPGSELLPNPTIAKPSPRHFPGEVSSEAGASRGTTVCLLTSCYRSDTVQSAL